MLKKIISAFAIAGSLGFMSLTTSIQPAAAGQRASHQANMEADGFTLWNDGEMNGIAFDVWTRPAREGGGFYYFLWGGQYADIVDYGSPEVVVYFNSNLAKVNGAWMVDCYNNGSYDNQCQNPDGKPAHFRHAGSCAFPWQLTSSGGRCGNSAATIRQSGF